MDNPLTPNKIQRLIHLAEDKSFNLPRRMLLNDEDLKRLTTTHCPNAISSANTNYESSSGILDLERLEGFGECIIENMSLSKSTAFNPGELTGRSTGTDEVNSKSIGFGTTRTFEEFGRHSLVLDSLTSQMNKQTTEIEDLMRHSIATNYSFHSKRDLTADEASLVMREAPLPVPPGTQTNFAESVTLNNSNMSMGTYFKNRCPEFGKILGKTDSPDRSLRPSISEVSANAGLEYAGKETSVFKMDMSLDSVPVKQPRNLLDTLPENRIINLNAAGDTQKNCNVSEGKKDVPTANMIAKTEVSRKYSQVSTSNVPNPVISSQKHFMTSSAKPTDVLLRNLQSSLRIVTDDTEGSVENSFSISKIADYLGKQSNVSVSDMLLMKKSAKKQPLTELQMNTQDRLINHNAQIASLRDSKNTAAASSASSINTVISIDKWTKQDDSQDIPAVIVTQHSANVDEEINQNVDHIKSNRRNTRSKSPSSKSQSTLSTVQENFASFKSEESLSKTSGGEAYNSSHVPSPNVEYNQLDTSVDWQDVLLQKHLKHKGFAKEQWADILSTPAQGFVGASCPVTITVTTITDSWLTAKFQFIDLPNNGRDLTVELPRQPFLLSPGKSEKFTLYLTSTVEMNTLLSFTMSFKDASINGELQQSGTVEVDIKMPEIQAMSCDGLNKVNFTPTVEKSVVTNSFVLVSDGLVDLQLDLSVSDGEGTFFITNAQEVKKSDINKVLMDRHGSTEEHSGRQKQKPTNKQLCRLSNGNAIKVTVAFNAPVISDLQTNNIISFRGVLDVNLMGVRTVLRKVELVGYVGTVKLVLNVPGKKLRMTSETANIMLQNIGTITGVWVVKYTNANNNCSISFSPSKLELRPGIAKPVVITCTGYDDSICETSLVFEEINSGLKTVIDVVTGVEKPKVFPIKANHNCLSWVQAGRKELSLKNASNLKVHIKCQVVGDGFSINLPGAESRGTYLLPFGPNECRLLPIMFNPSSNNPASATLHMVFDKNSDVSRKVKLYGCAGGDNVRWANLVTYGNTALVRAVSRAPIQLNLYNKSSAPAFVCARVHFNLQYMCVASTAQLTGGAHVLGGRCRHALSLRVDWTHAERRARVAPAATPLATLSVLTGAESTRRRIMRILKDESTGEVDHSLLPDHLKVLTSKLEGEDPSLDDRLADFKESKASLNELIGGLQELTAQIDLPQDFTDENTIIITDDTVIEHHTLCDH